MKRMLTVCAVILVISVAAQALPRGPCVGLFADAGHSVMSVNPAAPFTPFTLYVWFDPGDEGLIAAMYNLVFPSNVIRGAATQNSSCGITIGCDWGLCCYLAACEIDWTFTHYIQCFTVDSNPSFIQIVPYPGDSTLQTANCSLGYPVESATILNQFGVNQDGVIGAEPVSWGAVKGLF